jgi:glyoxylase-like metal-dependent hydrolase (beta-lactamase superfamily II)
VLLQRRESDLVRMAVTLPPDDAWQQLDEGDRIEAAGRTWRVRLTPGHADGHLVLHDEANGRLLAGDHLLERISPAVGRFPRHEKDPLARYMESLMAIAMVDPQLVLPGHGAPFSGAAERARALMAHHVERIDDCVRAVGQLDEPTAFQVARVVFARVFEEERPDAANQRFATTETLAHLERARFDGRLQRATDAAGLVRWQLA